MGFVHGYMQPESQLTPEIIQSKPSYVSETSLLATINSLKEELFNYSAACEDYALYMVDDHALIETN
jgi:hypothetical protein